MKKIFLALVVICLYSTAASACLSLAVIDYDEVTPTKDARKRIAAIIRDEIGKVHDAIPDLTPEDEKLLETELSTGSIMRRLAAANSDKNTMREAKLKTSNIVNASKAIAKSLHKNQEDEVAAWTVIAAELSDIALPSYIATLVKNKQIRFSGSARYAQQQHLLTLCNTAGIEILERIVLPHLQNQLPN